MRRLAPDILPAPGRAPAGAGVELRGLFQTLIRSFGLLSGDSTPCGTPLSVSHAHALMLLREHARQGRTPGQRELGTALGIDKSNVARLCARMEKAGHLRQARNRDDGRARLLRLTPRGRRVAEAVERSSRARFEALAAALPAGRRAAVLAALAVLNQAIAVTSGPRSTAARRPGPGRRPTGGST